MQIMMRIQRTWNTQRIQTTMSDVLELESILPI